VTLKKKLDEEKKYKYISFESCEKCGTHIIIPRPCPKCGNMIFKYSLRVVER